MTMVEERTSQSAMEQSGDDALLTISGLKVHFPVKRGLIFDRTVGVIKAVDGVSFSIKPGETLGLVGESGSGKTTTGRAILQLVKSTEGSVTFEGRDLVTLNNNSMRQMRRRLGMVFQDPYGALNPRMTAGAIIGEPLVVHGLHDGKADLRSQVSDLLETVGLNRGMADRYPHEFSGGQRQRIGVARALAARPSFMVLDEPVSALDVSIQAQIINLLQNLQEEFGLSYLFIAHDLSVVRHISDRVRGNVPWQDRGVGGLRRLVRKPAAPVHEGAPLGHTDSRSRVGPAQGADRTRGRYSQPAEPAIGVCVPYTVPRCDRRLLRVRARVARGCA